MKIKIILERIKRERTQRKTLNYLYVQSKKDENGKCDDRLQY